MEINNLDLVQSYVLTTAKYDFTAYEKRILYRLVECCQFALEGKKLNAGYSYQPTLFEGLYSITMPTGAFLADEDDNNHAQVKKALRSMRDKTLEYEYDDPAGGRTWKLIGLIELPKFNDRGYVEFKIHPEIHQAILHFSRGFKKYELKTAMSFKSVYSMRFYELLSGQKKPLSYTINQLAIMFKVENKYMRNEKFQTGDFIKYTVKVAKKELDEKSPYSFDYKQNKRGTTITSITFYPIYNPKNRDPDLEKKELQKKASVSWDLDRIVVNYLKENFAFTDAGIKNNIDLLKVAQNKIDLMFFLSGIRVKSTDKKNPQGWTLGAIKKELAKS
jgi:hypothetical protein